MRSLRSAVLSLSLLGVFPLNGAFAATLTRGPYLQMNNASGVTIRWRTNNATDSVVSIGASPGALATNTTNATLTTEHLVRVNGLQPDTKYYYSVGATGGAIAGGDATYFFRTAPTSGTDRAMRVWILGDCGTSGANQRAVRDAYYASADYRFNDLVLLLGDNAYNTGTDAEYQSAIFDTYPTVLRQSPVWSCLGNHETAQATSGNYSTVPYFAIFSFPTGAESGGYASGSERYFSWDFGNVHFISIDTQTTDATLRSNMLAWLDNDLAANVRRWTVALWHHPPYTKGSHNSDTESQLIWARENLVPKLEAAGVDLVLSGHSHSYERSRFIDGFYATPTLAGSGTVVDAGDGKEGGNGIYGKDYGSHRGAVYAVPGSAGQISGGTLNHPVMFTSLNELGSMILDVSGNRMDAKFINSAGVVRDAFSIEKGPIVTVSTPVPAASEFGPVAGRLSVARSGSTAAPLDVQVQVGGTAAGSRFLPLTVPVTIPAGASSQAVTVTPVPDATMQGAQTVTLSALANVNYRLGSTITGTVTISDLAAGDPPIAFWRLSNFGSAANTASISGDSADPDQDRLLNLLEYGLGLDPLVPSLNGLPEGSISDDYLTLSVQKNPAATDVTYRVQVSGEPGTGWTTDGTIILQNTATLLEARDNVSLSNAPRRFIRLQVTRP